MQTSNARDSILGDALIVDAKVRKILREMHDYLPDGPYEKMTKEQQSIIDAGIYLNVHRLAQATEILQELTTNLVTKEWAEKIIAAIREIESTPGTSIAEYHRAIGAENLRRLSAMKMVRQRLENQQQNKSVQIDSMFELFLSAQPVSSGQRKYQILLALLFALTLGLVAAGEYGMAIIVFLLDLAVTLTARHQYKRWKQKQD